MLILLQISWFSYCFSYLNKRALIATTVLSDISSAPTAGLNTIPVPTLSTY